METWDSPWQFFVVFWTYSMVFHLLMYLPMWFTKMGRLPGWLASAAKGRDTD